ncbi:hypothetical protein J2S21_000954 [Peribacillus cavernae]|nr:hypothetical protein [Peribacillus cavernae]
MAQAHSTTTKRTFKHLSETERGEISAYQKSGLTGPFSCLMKIRCHRYSKASPRTTGLNLVAWQDWEQTKKSLSTFHTLTPPMSVEPTSDTTGSFADSSRKDN